MLEQSEDIFTLFFFSHRKYRTAARREGGISTVQNEGERKDGKRNE